MSDFETVAVGTTQRLREAEQAVLKLRDHVADQVRRALARLETAEEEGAHILREGLQDVVTEGRALLGELSTQAEDPGSDGPEPDAEPAPASEDGE